MKAFLQRLADTAGALPPRRARIWLFMTGLVSGLAFAPLLFWPLLIPAFCLLLWRISATENGRQAVWDGWWMGFGHFLSSLYWIAIALMVEPEKFGWLMPFAVLGIPAVLAFYVSGVAWLAWALPFRGWRMGIAFAMLWVIAEWLRGHVFPVFPWNLAGYSLNASDALIQLASVTGAYGLSFLAVLLAILPALLVLPVAGGGRQCSLPVWSILLVVLGIAGWGQWRLSHAAELTTEEGPRIRIVQAAVEQTLKWKEPERWNGMQRHMDLTFRDADPQNLPRLVIWPETAVPYFIGKDPELIDYLARAAPPDGYLLTGALRDESSEAEWRLFNSQFAIDGQGDMTVYDKVTLVPFGEFVPLSWLLPLDIISYGMVDFLPGPGPQVIELPGTPPYTPLICYEAIFPGYYQGVRQAEWLLNITNDAWFGKSSGPYQHFQMARIRSIEEGLPMLRAANTGISAVVDAMGNVRHRLGLGEQGVLDANLPGRLSSPTYYRSSGDLLVIAIFYVIGIFLILSGSFYKLSHFCLKESVKKS